MQSAILIRTIHPARDLGYAIPLSAMISARYLHQDLRLAGWNCWGWRIRLTVSGTLMRRECNTYEVDFTVDRVALIVEIKPSAPFLSEKKRDSCSILPRALNTSTPLMTCCHKPLDPGPLAELCKTSHQNETTDLHLLDIVHVNPTCLQCLYKIRVIIVIPETRVVGL